MGHSLHVGQCVGTFGLTRLVNTVFAVCDVAVGVTGKMLWHFDAGVY